MGNTNSVEEQDEEAFDEKYALKQKLGAGVFGEVYLCSNRDDPEDLYAVKIVDTHSEANVDSFQTAAEEAALMKTLNHEYVVQLIEVFQGERFLKVVMELVDGGELFKVIQNPNMNFKDGDVKRISGQILHGLSYLHWNKVVHRDVKAENVMLSEEYRPTEQSVPDIKLIDFGMATKLEGGWLYEEQQLTLVCGTPHYIAPEIWSSMPGVPDEWVDDYGAKYGPKVDVWAAGVLVYLLIMGQYPYNGDSHQELASQACSQEIRPDFTPRYNAPGYTVPKNGVAFLEKLMEPDQNDRIPASQAVKEPWLTKPTRALTSVPSSLRTSMVQEAQKAALLKLGPAEGPRFDAEVQRSREAAFLAERCEAAARLGVSPPALSSGAP